jgi:hypothetical protein
MANISTYPLATPKATDLVLGTQTNALGTNHTKSFTVGSIADKVSSIQLGYTSLVQLLNQTGTAAPIATEVYNNTGQTFTWSSTTLRDIGWNRISDSIIEIETATLNDTITNGSFEVKIYN